ncbi:MAG: ABC transporter substrate-binding protein [Myxococcota bacterium]|nr:ABC transporter substrate-binding protein [Myxococcota bacterium]
MTARVLRFGHSPDADDAFLFHGFSSGAVRIDGWDVVPVLEPIESLNRRALRGELEITAMSVHALAHAGSRYDVLPAGASVGRGYGPVVVSARPVGPDYLRGRRIALPGPMTTATLVARLCLPPFDELQIDFDRAFDAVERGEADAAVVIHEGQVAWAERGLFRVCDLGDLWRADTGLPLPLGVDAVRADLDEDLKKRIARAVRASVEHALANADEAIDAALRHARGLDRDKARRFVGMYVNEDTVRMPADVREAIGLLLRRAAEAGLAPSAAPPRFVE